MFGRKQLYWMCARLSRRCAHRGAHRRRSEGFNALKQRLVGTGLNINLQKCSIFTSGNEQLPELLQGIEVNNEGVRILGSPLGTTNEFENKWCQNLVEECARDLTALKEYGMEDPQAAFQLLRLCFVPKINHLLRTVAPDNVRTAAAEHDKNIWKAFKHIHNLKFRPDDGKQIRIQAGLCAKDGGCGLNYASDTKEAAYVASLAAAIPRMQQIANRTRHPMSKDLADFNSNHPVMQALRTNRDRLDLQLDDRPDNPTVPTISEMNSLNSSGNLQRSLSERLSEVRRKS